MIANEKRRRRRESHNAVERRRRDNINEKISELATLIPECMLDASGMRLAPFLSSFPSWNTHHASYLAATQTPTSPTHDDVLLGNLIPEGATQVGTGDDSGKCESPGESVVKANKGMILRKSVEYIRCAAPLWQLSGHVFSHTTTL
jgi:Helix-loop-helix DNA-binding domain